MNIASLPSYPGHQSPNTAARKLSSGRARVLIDLALLAAIVALLWWLRWTVEGIKGLRVPNPPLDFRLVEERYDSIPWGGSRMAVERLLGPPTEHYAWGPELAEVERILENGGRNLMPEPEDRVWDRWSDPKDPGRWVAVLYGGYSGSARVYGRTKRGF
jgi:hypothetical protein